METRRSFLQSLAAGTALAGLAGIPAAGALPAGKVFRVGFLANHIPLADLERGAAGTYSSAAVIVEGLRALGWRAGTNIRFVWRSAEGQLDRHPRLARELVQEGVDLIVAFDEGANAAARATTTIPIVLGSHFDPIGTKLADSLARPGRNVTGLAQSAGAELTKSLALLKEAVPRASRLGLVFQTRDGADQLPAIRADSSLGKAVAALRFEPQFATFGDPETLPEMFRSLRHKGVQALVIAGTFSIYGHRKNRELVVQECNHHRLPAMHGSIGIVAEGGLMAHGADETLIWKRAPHYIDRILRGEKPGDIPIEQPAKIEFHVNLPAAKAIGLEMPKSILLQADRVFD